MSIIWLKLLLTAFMLVGACVLLAKPASDKKDMKQVFEALVTITAVSTLAAFAFAVGLIWSL